MSENEAGGTFVAPNLSYLNSTDPIEIFGLPLRLENYLKRGGKIKTIKELLEFPDDKFLSIKNVGAKTAQAFIQLKKDAAERLKESASTDKAADRGIEFSVPPGKMIELLLSQCRDERTYDVVVKRYGLRGEEKHTLEEIGQIYGLTRERIRQIQVKGLKRMNSPLTTAKLPITKLVEEALYINDGILSEEEADLQIPSALEEKQDDGSSVLDLLADLEWIQSSKIGDIVIYAPLFNGVQLENVSERIVSVVEKESLGINLPLIAKKVSSLGRVHDERFDPIKFTLRYCQIDPRMREVKIASEVYPLFQHYNYAGHFTKKGWIALMKRVLEEEQMPLHFTEVTNKVNDLLNDAGKQLDVRRAHSMLIEDKTFAHTGIRGMYGLTSWGLRRETTPQLIEECLRRAGFPLHWRQIYNYVSKYKDSKPGNIISVLEFNRMFKKINSGTYGLAEDKPVDPTSDDFTFTHA